MNYEPPIIYNVPEWLADRICKQGLTVANTVLTAEAAAATSAGDAANAAILTGYKNKVVAAGG